MTKPKALQGESGLQLQITKLRLALEELQDKYNEQQKTIRKLEFIFGMLDMSEAEKVLAVSKERHDVLNDMLSDLLAKSTIFTEICFFAKNHMTVEDGYQAIQAAAWAYDNVDKDGWNNLDNHTVPHLIGMLKSKHDAFFNNYRG